MVTKEYKEYIGDGIYAIIDARIGVVTLETERDGVRAGTRVRHYVSIDRETAGTLRRLLDHCFPAAGGA